MSQTINLLITGMTCPHCVASVEKAISAVNGVQNVDVNLESGEAAITGDIELEQLIAAVKEAGYEAQAK